MKLSLQCIIDGVTYRNCVLIPYKFENVLDATLDTGVLELDRVRRELFQPLTDLTLIPYDGEDEIQHDWIVAADDATEIPAGSGLYHHTLSLIELTKYGEGFICDSTCITHPGGNVYTDNALPVVPEET